MFHRGVYMVVVVLPPSLPFYWVCVCASEGPEKDE